MMMRILILTALAAVMPIVAMADPLAKSPACAYIDQWRGTNIPISPATSKTDVVHAVALTRAGMPIGWFVSRRDGQVWYLDGPVRGPRPLVRDSVAVLDLLGYSAATKHVDSVGIGQMIDLNKPADIRTLIANGLQLVSCY